MLEILCNERHITTYYDTTA